LSGSLVHRLARPNSDGTVRLGTPSGAIPIGATVQGMGGNATVDRITVYRTARRLMEGNVLVPASSDG
ncbi:MAG: hypothetical protein HOC72_20775, partial [Rhodospirillaceae bacterium]|nr:hypothetical protein [Rhodospirillaceae bacterium]